MQKINFCLILLLFIFIMIIGNQTLKINKLLSTLDKNGHVKEIELATYMGAIQRFADKLYFSGLNQNWELAKFYIHEIEEQIEVISVANISEENIAITPLLSQMIIPTIKNLETSVNKTDVKGFIKHYKLMITSCNSCHSATNHGFIRLKIPKMTMFANQDFSKRKIF